MRRYLGAALAIAAAACASNKSKAPLVQTAVVNRRDIIIDAQATGVIEPINIIEVKSKAGGAILKMPVETGTLVKTGDLLVQVDPRDAQNRYDQAKSSLDAAQAKLTVSQTSKKRQDDLFNARVITATEHETAAVDYENSKAAVVSMKANLDIAKQALEDATVVAPSAGTIIDKSVSEGTVIASATNSVSGGTTLLKMADLNIVRIRASFNETDIGSVRGGQPATVTVDAYPTRPFTGLVEKIEPQAVTVQNVTMFPVLITLDNREGLLKPGMNGEVSVLIDERDDVISVPNDALKSTREAAATAMMLGINPDSAQMEVRAQGGGGRGGFNRGGGANGGPNGGANGNGAPNGKATPTPAAPPAGAATTPRTSGGEVTIAPQGQQDPQQGGGRGGRGGGFQMPQVTEADCVALDNEWKKHPKEKKQIDALRAEQDKARASGADRDAIRAIGDKMRPIYQSAGIDMMKNGACRRLRGQDTGRGRGGNGAPGGGLGSTTKGGSQGNAGRRNAGAELQPSPEMGGQRQRTRSGLVFVADNNSYHARVVQLGQGNFDYTEVVSGLKEGERVALLASLALQVQRQQQNDRNRQNANPLGGAPGGRGGPGGGPGGPGGGGGGGGRAGGRG